jgi:hypothetical protein
MTRSQRIHKYVEDTSDHMASSIHAQAARIAALEIHLDDEDAQDALADEFGATVVGFDQLREARNDRKF